MGKWLAAFLILAFFYLVRGVLAPFIVAAILAYILVPGVEYLSQRFRVPRRLVVVATFVLLLAAIGLTVALVEPALARETKDLVQNTPAILESLFVQTLGSQQLEFLGTTVDAKSMADRLLAATREALGRPSEALHIAEGALRGVLDVFLVLIVLFYLLLDWQRLVAFGFRLVPAQRRTWAGDLAASIHVILGKYIRGQFYLVLLMAGVTWIVLTFVFHLRFALPIAIATGLLEVIPLVGPVVAAGIAASVGLAQGGGQMAIGLLIFYTVARQVEDQVVMPLVVGRAVHLHPVATLFAALCGGAIAGVLGMVLAVPVAAALAVILDDVWPG